MQGNEGIKPLKRTAASQRRRTNPPHHVLRAIARVARNDIRAAHPTFSTPRSECYRDRPSSRHSESFTHSFAASSNYRTVLGWRVANLAYLYMFPRSPSASLAPYQRLRAAAFTPYQRKFGPAHHTVSTGRSPSRLSGSGQTAGG